MLLGALNVFKAWSRVSPSVKQAQYAVHVPFLVRKVLPMISDPDQKGTNDGILLDRGLRDCHSRA